MAHSASAAECLPAADGQLPLVPVSDRLRCPCLGLFCHCRPTDAAEELPKTVPACAAECLPAADGQLPVVPVSNGLRCSCLGLFCHCRLTDAAEELPKAAPAEEEALSLENYKLVKAIILTEKLGGDSSCFRSAIASLPGLASHLQQAAALLHYTTDEEAQFFVDGMMTELQGGVDEFEHEADYAVNSFEKYQPSPASSLSEASHPKAPVASTASSPVADVQAAVSSGDELNAAAASMSLDDNSTHALQLCRKRKNLTGDSSGRCQG